MYNKSSSRIKKVTAFTLMEIMVVLIILGLMAGFAVPNYTKMVAREHEIDAVNQLKIIHAANELYRIHEDEYLQGTNLRRPDINSGLGIKTMRNELNYTYSSFSASEYDLTAEWTGKVNFKIFVNESPLEDDVNPCCDLTSTDACPTLADCTASTAVCGNSIVESGEGCDDGNTANGDGCSANCQVE